MSTQPYPAYAPAMLTANSALTKKERAVSGLSLGGLWLFLAGFFVLGSGFTAVRPEVMGMSIHPYLAPVAVAFPIVLLTRIHTFPVRILAAFAVFCAIYSLSVCNGADIALGEIVKTLISVVTIITCALLVRKRGDFVAGSLGLALAIAILAVNGLREDTKLGVDAMQGANKNSYSLYALPAVLLSGYIAVHMKNVPMAIKGLLVACTLPTLAAIFMSGNRSGYLGAVVVGLMLFWERRGKGMLLVAAVAGAVAFGITQYGSTQIFDEKMKQTVEGNKSDEHRKDILLACMDIALENPLIGVSPQVLPFEIGRRTSIRHGIGQIEAHNAFAHVLAASGIFCFAALIAIGYCMYKYTPRDGGRVGGAEDPLRAPRKLLRMLVILWVVRGMFTREILYNPSFNIALGLVIGLCMLAEQVRIPIPAGGTKSKPSYPPLPGLAPPQAGR